MLTHRDYVETTQRICKDYVETMYLVVPNTLSSHHSKLSVTDPNFLQWSNRSLQTFDRLRQVPKATSE